MSSACTCIAVIGHYGPEVGNCQAGARSTSRHLINAQPLREEKISLSVASGSIWPWQSTKNTHYVLGE